MEKQVRWFVAVVSVVVLALLAPVAVFADEADLPDDAVFLAAASGAFGAEAVNLEVEQKAASNLADGRTIYWAKVWDSLAGEVYEVALDEALQPLNVEEAAGLADEAYAARFGKLAESLHEALQPMDDEALMEVAISLAAPAELGVDRPTRKQEAAFASEADVEAFWNERIAVYQEGVAYVEAPFVAELQAAGREIVYVSPDTPLIIARLPKSAVLALSTHPAVAEVWETKVMEEEINTVKNSVYAPNVWTAGFTGTGVKVGISEVGGKAATANPYLSLASNASSISCANSAHGTAVAGILRAYRSTDTTYRGMAYGATAYYHGACNGSWTNLKNGWSSLRSKGAKAINSSWGADTNRVMDYTDKEIDTYFRNYGIFMVKSAGNRGAGTGCPASDGDVTSPGLAYNVMSVGNYNNKRTTAWGDDTMANTCSSWGDPKSGRNDREKPEVAAPGTNIKATRTASPWIGNVGSGTSYAAPVVTGQAALLMQKNTGLQGWPEPLKAIIMASAMNGVNQAYRGAGGSGPRVSEAAGAGGVDFSYAYDITRGYRGTFKKATVYYSSFGSAGYFRYNVYWPVGKKVRVALAWDTNPAKTNYNATSVPSSDLDLRVFLGSTRKAYSSTYDNTYEIVEFTTTAAGTYQVRVYRYRWGEGGTTTAYRTYAGLAWRYY
ncbi:MAG: S8 family peptidase [Chloroflexi bacterium]|nr:S8 family peptidase [Chloroflexota bacterium]